MWPGAGAATHLVTRGVRRGLKLVPERHVRLERASVRAQPPRRTLAPHIRVFTVNLPSELQVETAPAASVTVFAECKGDQRNGGGARHADGGRSAGRARGAAGAGRAAWAEGHHLDQAVRRRATLSHHRQKLTGTLRSVWRHRRSSRYNRQADQQEQRIWICKNYFDNDLFTTSLHRVPAYFVNPLKRFYILLHLQANLNTVTRKSCAGDPWC